MHTSTRRLLVLVALLHTTTGYGAELVSPFAGSSEIGAYQTDFDRFQYLVDSNGTIEAVTTEGRLSSRMFVKPSDKSTYEVFRSYEKELNAAGFEMLAVLDGNEMPVRTHGAAIYRGKGTNDLSGRAYRLDGKPPVGGGADWLASFAEHYIAARKIEGDVEYLVAVLVADRKDLYLVDTFESAVMEQNTVALSLDALRSQIAADGRIALYGVQFATGSATLREESDAALAVISQYLLENPQRSFYVVGHTDDVGTLASNLKLSQARADSTREAIVARVSASEPGIYARLSAHGVGPLSPIATNGQEDGRQLNRRVELVSASD